jgi:predicted dienelactone hydrolase
MACCVNLPVMPMPFYSGCFELSTRDSRDGQPIRSWILYPTESAPQTQSFGPYSLPLAMNAEPAGNSLPLVAISHGNGGTPWSHRETALCLAKAGFAVALLEHTGNCRSDNSQAFRAITLTNRPHQLHCLINEVAHDSRIGNRVRHDRFSVIGHSIGGYTALALAGGQPTSLAQEEEDGIERTLDVAHDHRVRALVLLAPATIWFRAPHSLSSLRLPIFMRTGACDAITPSLHAQIVLEGVADRLRVEHRIVENAGHFSFQSPFPPAMVRADFPPSQDPPGFDRASYHDQLNGEILDFLRRVDDEHIES